MPDESAASMNRLTVDYRRGDVRELLRRESGILYAAEFAAEGASAAAVDDPRHVQVELDPLNSPGLHEIWTTTGPIETGRAGSIAFARSPHYLFAQLSFDRSDDLVAATEDAYLQLLRFSRNQGHGNVLRVWNYLRDINAGRDDRERYRLFCLGRSEALRQLGYDESLLPAATAIGTRAAHNELLVYLLASREPGVAVENPRQVSAYRYPRRYGPRSPAFSRAMYVPQVGGAGTLLVSGTASIVGHLSEHAGHVHKQTTETLANIDALVSDAALQTGYGPTRHDAVLAKAYLRHRDDARELTTTLERWCGPDRYLLLGGDICRSDLLLEVEAIVPLTKSVARTAAQ